MAPAGKHYHAVQFYKDAHSLAETVARFLADGIDIGEPGIVIATRLHTAAILRELKASGLDPQKLRQSGQLHLLDARKMLSSFMVGGLPDPLLFKSNVGNVIEDICKERRHPCPLRAYGEMVDLLWQDGNANGAIKLEMLWNRLASTYDFALLCGYSFGHFYKQTHDPRYQQVIEQHSEVITGA